MKWYYFLKVWSGGLGPLYSTLNAVGLTAMAFILWIKGIYEELTWYLIRSDEAENNNLDVIIWALPVQEPWY